MSIGVLASDRPRLGTVTLDPEDPVVAGTVGTWRVCLVVGSYGIDEGGTVKIARRFASDWEEPQFERPGDAGYTTVRTTGAARLSIRYDSKGHVRPWMRCIVIDVYDGSLAPGDVIEVVLGDRSGGSPGIRAQSFQESAHELRVLVDPTNACLVREVEGSPVIPIVAGEAETIVCIMPSDVAVGESADLYFRGCDAWGNPTAPPSDCTVSWEGTPGSAVASEGRLAFKASGHGVVVVQSAVGDVRSNPIRIHATAPAVHAYWGDLHAQTAATVGTGTEEEYFTYGRDQARLDFTSHQGNDFQVTDEDWARLNRVTARFHEEGRFVVFPGYEWSANSPAGGDRNVIYREEGLPIIRSSHWQIPGADGRTATEDTNTPAHPADVFCQAMRSQVPQNKVLMAAHVGGRYADIRHYFDESLETLVEVVSCWGVFEWMIWDAFDRGARVGFMCNSDGHKGRPGDEGPGAGQFGIGNGLTCVLAESLTRESVFSALKSRRCYGTSGPRILLDFQVNGHPMGSEFEAAQPVSVVATAVGTDALESIELYAGQEVINTVRSDVFAACARSRRLRIMWGGSRMRGRGRRAVWDGVLHVTGNKIDEVVPVAFDSPADRIVSWDASEVVFRSRTTGDLDGVDLWLADDVSGRIDLATPLGEFSCELKQLTEDPVIKPFGGLDLHVCVQRYPEDASAISRTLDLSCDWSCDSPGVTPLFVKVTQVDGHMAWASPVYVRSV